jgi:hypothetical protein
MVAIHALPGIPQRPLPSSASSARSRSESLQQSPPTTVSSPTPPSTAPKSSKGTDSSSECESYCGQTAEPVLEEQVASESSSLPSVPATVDLSTSPLRSPSGPFHHPRTQQGKLYKDFTPPNTYSTQYRRCRRPLSHAALVSAVLTLTTQQSQGNFKLDTGEASTPFS